ncbi:hypothetical protein V5O48_011969, partial [Marasmius crinis-equi]
MASSRLCLKLLFIYTFFHSLSEAFKITAPQTIIVGQASTASWSHNATDNVFELQLLQDSPSAATQTILTGPTMTKPSGSVLFAAQETGSYRVVGIQTVPGTSEVGIVSSSEVIIVILPAGKGSTIRS